jgi:twitching motility protein PilT
MSSGIDQLLTIACSKGASDLHIKAGSFPFIRVNGDLQPMVEAQRLSAEDTLNMAFSIMNNRQKQRFSEVSEIDIAYALSGLGRFRCNIFQQRGSVGMVLRVIPTILVTGTTGSGKSTTLASIIDYINRSRTGHIVTIEDPIEFLHRDKKSYVNQREIDVDTRSFFEALRGALRQDPDVILVGEMRDKETIETALMASETGHLVLSTLHTLDATETVNRIVSVFPPHQQNAIRLQLASVLRGVISMRLVRAADSIQGRVPAVEVLVATPYIKDCVIYPEKTSLIRDAIAQGTSQYGMQTFDQSLFDLYSRELITYEEALTGATNPDEFKLRVSGIRSTSDQAREDMERSRKRTTSLDVGNKAETKQFVNWLLEGKEQVGR